MEESTGSLGRHTTAVVCLIWGLAATAFAQSPGPASTVPELLPRAEFHLGANSLDLPAADERFSWDAYFGGAVDIADYVKGRASILADYHPVLGSELRPFDPNQAYYVLEASGSYRAGATEVAVVFHHVSRHLSDRPKPFAVAWNVLGARVLRHAEAGRTTLDLRAGGGAIVQHSFVDYQWTADTDVVVRRGLTPHVGFFAHGTAEVFGVDGSELRGSQTGARIEAGLRIDGRGAAVELFAGYERRIDADPIDRQPMHWGLAGFRLLSRGGGGR